MQRIEQARGGQEGWKRWRGSSESSRQREIEESSQARWRGRGGQPEEDGDARRRESGTAKGGEPRTLSQQPIPTSPAPDGVDGGRLICHALVSRCLSCVSLLLGSGWALQEVHHPVGSARHILSRHRRPASRGPCGLEVRRRRSTAAAQTEGPCLCGRCMMPDVLQRGSPVGSSPSSAPLFTCILL